MKSQREGDERHNEDSSRPHVSLTRREREVALLAAEGATAREIAALLSISVRTVETHLHRIYVKLGVHSKPRLAARAAELLR